MITVKIDMLRITVLPYSIFTHTFEEQGDHSHPFLVSNLVFNRGDNHLDFNLCISIFALGGNMELWLKFKYTIL